MYWDSVGDSIPCFQCILPSSKVVCIYAHCLAYELVFLILYKAKQCCVALKLKGKKPNKCFCISESVAEGNTTNKFWPTCMSSSWQEPMSRLSVYLYYITS